MGRLDLPEASKGVYEIMPKQDQREMTPEENERYQRMLSALPPMVHRRELHGNWITEQGTIIKASDMNPVFNVLEVENARTDLLVWAGLHRGKDISESIMPRFHEIIDRLDKALGHYEVKE